MMKKMKSLSDSSTSESEDDFSKRNRPTYDTWSGTRRTNRSHSTDDTEDEQTADNSFYQVPKQMVNFKSPVKNKKRTFSTDDTEDENLDSVEFSSKRFKDDLSMHAELLERELAKESDSETEDKRSFINTSYNNMPSMDAGNYSVGRKLIEKMGYKDGQGLGKFEQGRVGIVEASKQRGRRGLGLKLAELEPSDIIWDTTIDEEISTEESVEWIPPSHLDIPSITELRDWMVEGEKKETISDEVEFCNPEILKKVITYKSVFDNLEPEELRKARTRSNPFETIRGGIFLNRAAMKMANMDYAFDFMFTNPRRKSGDSAVGRNELLYFADVCAGPGGFSEYVLWRKKWECKGFGFTLKQSNDFKLEDFYAGPPETFEPYYGELKDGDVYSPTNLRSLQKFILNNTENRGVHFMMADGGFSVEGQENEQEILSKRLYLCQFQAALSILRPDGHFVCKLFDIFTAFSVGLIYLMYLAFEQVCIFKPNTSRPANSERYIVCKWLKGNTKDIADYLFEINCQLDKFVNVANMDITEIVPLSILKSNTEFYDYIVESNNKLGARQIIHLDKIKIFAKNSELHEERQADIRKKCLELWGIPDEIRKPIVRKEAGEKYTELMKGETLALSKQPEIITQVSLSNSMKRLNNVFDYHCVVCGESSNPNQSAALFLSLGRSYIHQFDSKNMKWILASGSSDMNLELPADTLFYGELIYELKGESKGQRKITSLHIIDIVRIGDKDVRKLHFKERMIQAEKLAKAVSKPSRTDYVSLRVKKVWSLKGIDEVFDKLSMKFIKHSQVPRLCYDLDDGRHMIPTGLLIFQTTAEDWMTCFSKTSKRFYYFNQKQKQSSYERDLNSIADFRCSFNNRVLWKWERGVRLILEQTTDVDKALVQGSTLSEFVRNNHRRITL